VSVTLIVRAKWAGPSGQSAVGGVYVKGGVFYCCVNECA